MKSKITLCLASIAIAFALSIGAHAAEDADRQVTVFKTPWCGCCEDWVKALERAGYTVERKDMEDLTPIKRQAGVSKELEACHTAVIGGERKYVLEGHVPLEAIDKLMSDRPDIRGIATPGMPMGSLGMGEDPNARYNVLAFTGNADDTPSIFYEAGKK